MNIFYKYLRIWAILLVGLFWSASSQASWLSDVLEIIFKSAGKTEVPSNPKPPRYSSSPDKGPDNSPELFGGKENSRERPSAISIFVKHNDSQDGGGRKRITQLEMPSLMTR